MSEKLRIEDLKVGDKVEYCGWPSRTTWNTYEVVEVTRDRTGPCVILHNTCGPCCHQQTIDNGYLRRVPAPEPVPASAEGTKVLVKPSGSDWVYYVPKSLVDEVKKLAEGAEAKLTQRVAELEKALKSETHELARVKAERDTAMQATKKAQEEVIHELRGHHDETGWLVEWVGRGDMRPSRPTWWSGMPHNQWTHDSLEAVRFARREDAEAMIERRWHDWDGTPEGYIATEHMWIHAMEETQSLGRRAGSATVLK